MEHIFLTNEIYSVKGIYNGLNNENSTADTANISSRVISVLAELQLMDQNQLAKANVEFDFLFSADVRKVIKNISESPANFDYWLRLATFLLVARVETSFFFPEDLMFKPLEQLFLESELFQPISFSGEAIEKIKVEKRFFADCQTRLVIRILAGLTKSPEVGGVVTFDNFKLEIANHLLVFTEKSQKLISDFTQRIDDTAGRAEELRRALEKYESAFNFVGLYEGFRQLKDQLLKSRLHIRLFLFVTAALMMLLIGYNAFHFASLSKEPVSFGVGIAGGVATSISCFLLLLYFFRIALRKEDALSNQLMQIQLRQTLCQFIQSYAEYAKELKSNDGPSLEKFESIIFSGIVNSDEKLPSTFDGVEQLGNLIKTLKVK